MDHSVRVIALLSMGVLYCALVTTVIAEQAVDNLSVSVTVVDGARFRTARIAQHDPAGRENPVAVTSVAGLVVVASTRGVTPRVRVRHQRVRSVAAVGKSLGARSRLNAPGAGEASGDWVWRQEMPSIPSPGSSASRSEDDLFQVVTIDW